MRAPEKGDGNDFKFDKQSLVESIISFRKLMKEMEEDAMAKFETESTNLINEHNKRWSNKFNTVSMPETYDACDT